MLTKLLTSVSIALTSGISLSSIGVGAKMVDQGGPAFAALGLFMVGFGTIMTHRMVKAQRGSKAK